MINIIDWWWKSKHNHLLVNDKHFSITFYSNLMHKFGITTNGAKRYVDKHLDFKIWIFGLCINYVDFEYNK